MRNKIKRIAKIIKSEVGAYRLIMEDKRTPPAAKRILKFAVAYILCPIDLIPDFIPIIGSLDEVIIIPMLVAIAFNMIPKEVIEESRAIARARAAVSSSPRGL